MSSNPLLICIFIKSFFDIPHGNSRLKKCPQWISRSSFRDYKYLTQKFLALFLSRLHSFLLSHNNQNLLGNFRDSERYYELLVALVLRTEDLGQIFIKEVRTFECRDQALITILCRQTYRLISTFFDIPLILSLKVTSLDVKIKCSRLTISAQKFRSLNINCKR